MRFAEWSEYDRFRPAREHRTRIRLRHAASRRALRAPEMTRNDNENRVRPTRGQRLVAFGFLGAFGLTILTVLLTGLWVRSPKHEALPAVEEVEQPARSTGASAPPTAREPYEIEYEIESGNQASPHPDGTDEGEPEAATERSTE